MNGHVVDRKRAVGGSCSQIPDYTAVLEPALYLAPPGNLPSYPTGAIPNDLPMVPRSVWLQVTYKL